MLAHGGVALLAVVFALAAATVSLASAVAQEVVSVLQQTTYDPESEGSGVLQFTVFGKDVLYAYVLQSAIVVALIAALLFGLWRVMRGTARTCPECRSEIPRAASICRYCTTDLPPLDG